MKFETKYSDVCFFINLYDELTKDNDILKSNGIREVKIEDMTHEERIQCKNEYLNNIAELSAMYNSIEWWANAISEKNEYQPYHYRNLCSFYSLIKTLRKYMNRDMRIFIVCNYEIFAQLKIYCEQNHIRIISAEEPVILRLKKIYEKIYTAVHIVYTLTKIAVRKMYIHYMLACRIKRGFDNAESYYVIRTWADKRFLTEKSPIHNTHFWRLPEYVIQHGYNLMLLVGITNNFTKIIKKIREDRTCLVIPEEYFFRYSDFLQVFKYLHVKKIVLKKKIFFNGLDVTALYETGINRNYFSVYYLFNIVHYILAKRLAQAVKLKTFIQTFENYAWEKMTLLGIREFCSDNALLGFQHAYVSRNSFKYFPGKMERDVMPLPDRIVTMGKRTREIMERFGSYNKDTLKVGCALRQGYLNNIKPFKRRRMNRIVVPLTMVKKESVILMDFLYRSGLAKSELEVVIRCHPAAPYKSFRKDICFRLPENFIINNEKSASEELSRADIVIYIWTTVAIEALKMGLPVIYLDILYPMYVDPLFECKALKREVSIPDKLVPAIEGFYNMDDDDFYKEQQSAQEYLREYFYPVNEENLQAFLPV